MRVYRGQNYKLSEYEFEECKSEGEENDDVEENETVANVNNQFHK